MAFMFAVFGVVICIFQHNTYASDIDECITGTNNCSTNANCVNSPGSYTCSCEFGYTGNGVHCIEIEDCKKRCNILNSRCNYTAGEFSSCVCSPGYSHYSGTTCISDLHIFCFANSDCSNTSITASTADCCNHEISPFGLSYTVPGHQECHKCPVEFGFVMKTFTAMESPDPYSVDLAFFSGQSSEDFFITFKFISIEAEEEDIAISSLPIHIPEVQHQEGLQLISENLMFRTDLVSQEGNESFVLKFSLEKGTLENSIILHDRFYAVIIDVTNVDISFDRNTYHATEGNDAKVIVARNAFLASSVTLTLLALTSEEIEAYGIKDIMIPRVQSDNTWSYYSNASSRDFDNSPVTRTFEANSQRQIAYLSFNIQLFEDDVIERSTQIFVVLLTIDSAVNSSLIGGQRTSLCEISDNDELTIGFQLNMYDFFAPKVRNLSAPIIKYDDKALELNSYCLQIDTTEIVYIRHNGSGFFDFSDAESSIECYLANENVIFYQVLFNSGVHIYRVSVSWSDMRLNGSSMSAPYLTTEFRIFDADYIIDTTADVKFEKTSYTFNEGQSAKICVIANDSPANITSDFGIRLQYSTATGTADNCDFLEAVLPTLFLVFHINSTTYRECFQIPLYSDRFYESLEYFSVHLHADNGHKWVNVSLPETKVFIQDESVVAIGFIREHYITWEGNLHLELLNVDQLQSKVNVSLVLTTFYDRRIFTFSIGANESSISIDDENDHIFELSENWDVELKFAEFVFSSRLSIEANTTVLTINDDDDLHFATNLLLVESEEKQNLSLFLNHGAFGDLHIFLDIASDDNSGNATVGVDYAPILPTTLHFSRNNLSHEVPVHIKRDWRPESQEYFDIVILNVRVTDVFGAIWDVSDVINSRIFMSGRVFIHDSLDFSFSLHKYFVDEDAGFVLVEIVKQAYTRETISLLFQTVDGSASSKDVDFINTTEILVFAPDEYQKAVNVTIIDDKFPEANENFTVMLSELFSNSDTSIDSIRSTVIIADNDVAPGVIPNSVLAIVVALAVLVGLLFAVIITVLITMVMKANKNTINNDIYATIQDFPEINKATDAPLDGSFDAESFESISEDYNSDTLDIKSNSELAVVHDKIITTPNEAYGNKNSANVISDSERNFEPCEHLQTEVCANASPIEAFAVINNSLLDTVVNDAYGIELSESQENSESTATAFKVAYASSLDTSGVQQMEQIETMANEAYSTPMTTIECEANEAYGSQLDSGIPPLSSITDEPNEAYGGGIDSKKPSLSSINVESNEAYGSMLDSEAPPLSGIIVEPNEAYRRKLDSEAPPQSGRIIVEPNEAYGSKLDNETQLLSSIPNDAYGCKLDYETPGSITVESNEAYGINYSIIDFQSESKVEIRSEECATEVFKNSAEIETVWCKVKINFAPQLESSENNKLDIDSPVIETYSPSSEFKSS